MSERPLALVVAVAANGTIGRNGGLPWSLPEDLAWFKRVTMGKAMIMGRRTWDSIGRPLPGRESVVLTRDRAWSAEGAHVVHSIREAIELAARLRPAAAEIAVIGGAELFRATLPLARRIYWTEVHEAYEGDTAFPPFERAGWREVSRDRQDRVDFVVMERE
ncbi:MAG: dihydrofolate reductase [Solirubrobacterales bacterium]